MAVNARLRRFQLPASPRFYLVGDSLTSAHAEGRGGWRSVCYRALVESGYSPDFRGSIVNTTDNPPISTATAGHSHSGLDGAHGVNWYSSYWDTNFPTFATPAEYPQIVCIAVGSNDADTAAAATNFSRLIDKAHASVPTCHVLMWTAPHIESDPAAYDTQAAQVRLEVAARQAAGRSVSLVDAHAVPLVTGDWADGLHLTTRGYHKLADQAWLPAMLKVLES